MKCARSFSGVATAGAGGLALALVLFRPEPAAGDDPAGEIIEVPGVAESEPPTLRLTGMTFVGSRDDHSELVLRSRLTRFRPDSDIAELEDVKVVVTDATGDDGFEMSCERAELNLETNDFVARGDVRGTTATGEHYSAPYVVYDHEESTLHSDAPVTMTDDTGLFRGDGFRYNVKDRSFRLLGNVVVEQTP